MTAQGSRRHVVRRRWWWASVLGRSTRRQARLTLVAVAALSFALGSGAAALVGTRDKQPLVEMTALGPILIHLPDDLGPWSAVPGSNFDPVRGSDALRGAVIDGAWGVVAPTAVVVTVMTTKAGTHGGLTAVGASIPSVPGVQWDGAQRHVAGVVVGDGVRELLLVLEVPGGELVIVSVSGPLEAFDSGTLQEAFRTAVLDG